MGPTKYTGAFGDKELRHLLRRTLFGYNKEDFNSFRGRNLEDVITELMQPVPVPSPPLNNYGVEAADPDVPAGQTWVTAPAAWHTDPDNGGQIVDLRNNSLRNWLLKHMIQGSRRLHYKMVLFWHNHLANQIGFVGTGKIAYQHFRTIWEFSYDNFKKIIRDITIDPHMLIFLNGTANIKEAPDENYARELQELFCVGKGPKAAFTESDVQEAARVLTGWGVDWDTVIAAGEVQSNFFDFQHETRDKQFSSFYNNRVITGRSGATGAGELDDLLDMIVEHPETARFISRKLHRFFISHEIDAQAEADFIEPLAELFIDSNYDMRVLLEAFFTSAYFFEEKNLGAMIKSPLDAVTHFVKNSQVGYIADSSDLDEDYWTHLMLNFSMFEMGFFLGEPPSVSGWPAFYQIPSYDKLWITTFTLISRIIVSDTFIHQGFWTPQKRIQWNLLDYIGTLDDPFDPNRLIDELCDQHLAVPLSDELKTDLKSILLTGQTTDAYWTGAWGDYVADRTNAMAREIVEVRLKNLLTTFFQLPEYQLL